MSIVNYANKTYIVIHDIKNDDSYFNYSHCQNTETKEYVVVEKINKLKLREELNKLVINDLQNTYVEYLNAYKRDLELLKESNCKNLLEGIDFIDEEDQIIVIKEYADKNLRDYIKKVKGHGISPKEIRYIFRQLNNALQVFRNKKNIHTCLCNENIFLKFKDHDLITDDYTVKMADYGYLSKLEVQAKIQLNIKQKIPFMAPELFNPNKGDIQINEKCDLWCLGILLYFLRFNELPFESELYKTYKIFRDPQDPLLKDLINKLLVKDPSKRISWDEYFEHKFFEIPENEEKEIYQKRIRHRESTIRKEIIKIETKGKNGKMNVTYDNGDKYEGDFVDNVKEGKGIYYFSNGDKYEGEFFEDEKDGYGIYYYKNGEKYEGEFKENKKDGHGIYYYLDGDRYEGEFKKGYAEGRGAYYYQDGEKYVGDYKEDKRHGHGIYFYSNGDKYIGEFKNGKKDGKGALYDENGEKIKDLYFENGERVKKKYLLEDNLINTTPVASPTPTPTLKNKKDNKENKDNNIKEKFTGKGVKIYKGEGKYDGDFVDGLKQGKGTYFYENGDKYIGEFFNDEKEGYGIYYYDIGDKYEGYFFKNQKHGKGTYYYADGDKYEGRFKKGMAEGRGKFFYSNGDRYFGTYKKDKKEGHGIYYYYKDGSRYDGDFKDGKKHGNGIIVNKNGDYYDVKYENNTLIEKGPIFQDYDNSIKLRNLKKTNTNCVEKYEGQTINDQKEGKGKIIYVNGDTYVGDFINNLKDGNGE